jgi:hypothetical protein
MKSSSQEQNVKICDIPTDRKIDNFFVLLSVLKKMMDLAQLWEKKIERNKVT